MCLSDYPPLERSAGSACKHERSLQKSRAEIVPGVKNFRGKKEEKGCSESAPCVMNNVAPQCWPLIDFNNLAVLQLTLLGPREELGGGSSPPLLQ